MLNFPQIYTYVKPVNRWRWNAGEEFVIFVSETNYEARWLFSIAESSSIERPCVWYWNTQGTLHWYTALLWIALHFTALQCKALHWHVQPWNLPHCIAFYCQALPCYGLHCIALTWNIRLYSLGHLTPPNILHCNTGSGQKSLVGQEYSELELWKVNCIAVRCSATKYKTFQYTAQSVTNTFFWPNTNTEYYSVFRSHRILNIEYYSVLRKSKYRIPNTIRYQENSNTEYK